MEYIMNGNFWWIKILFGAGLLGIIFLVLWYMSPVLDIIQYLIFFVAIPLAILAGLRLVSRGTYDALVGWVPALQNRVNTWYARMQEAAARGEPIPPVPENC